MSKPNAKLLKLILFAWVASALVPSLMAQRNRIAGRVDNSRRVWLKGNVHPRAQAENDEGPVESSLELPYVTMILKQTPAQVSELEQLLADQQNSASTHFHQWLTPEEYADRFGVSQDDVNKIESWLESQDLAVAAVGRARTWIAFSGSAAAVQNAFGAKIHRFHENGESHFANTTEPSLPAAFDSIVAAIQGLNNFRLKPAKRPRPNYNTSKGNHYLAPDDLAAIYNMKPLYDSGIDGAGQKLVVVGQTQVDLADVRQFRTYFNLPDNDPKVMLVPNTQDPGMLTDDMQEADLDLEWAGAVARKAEITYVYSDDVMTSAQYAIDQNIAPVMTISYGYCEAQSSTAEAVSLRSWARQANAQGISWFAASGDSGGADCASGNSRNPGGLAVDIPASLPEVTGVGGTTFNEGSGTFWNSTMDGNRASAMSYIPENAWNDDSSSASPAATGGGASLLFSKPGWQNGAGVPNDGSRDVPDVSLSASADHDGYMVYTGGKLMVFGGTSAGAPSFAGLAALINHYLVANGIQANAGVGNMNPRLYALAQTTAGVFHDVTTGDNIINITCSARSRNCTPGPIGFTTGPGYDAVTGLGSVDAYNLVTSWNAGGPSLSLGAVSMALTSSAASIAAGDNVVLTATVVSANGGTPLGAVAFTLGGVSLGTATLAGTGGKATAALSVTGAQLSSGANSITAQYTGSNGYDSAAASVSVTVAAAVFGPPSISSLANAASFTQTYAPGTILTVFGSQLASSAQSAGKAPLPAQLAGASATINGIPAPLYYVSPGQLNIQIPYETPASGTALLRVTHDGQSASTSFAVSAAAPGIFTDQIGALVPSSGATRGQTITLYMTGIGAVTPAIATGSAPAGNTALADLPKPQQSVTVKVGGIAAAMPLPFIGIPWGLVGVTQINFQVPAGAPIGNQPVVVTVGGISSPAGSLNVH